MYNATYYKRTTSKDLRCAVIRFLSSVVGYTCSVRMAGKVRACMEVIVFYIDTYANISINQYRAAYVIRIMFYRP
jgi:hypothetical protein